MDWNVEQVFLLNQLANAKVVQLTGHQTVLFNIITQISKLLQVFSCISDLPSCFLLGSAVVETPSCICIYFES